MSIKGLIAIVSLVLLSRCQDPASLNALVISDNPPVINHLLKRIVENTGLFDVDINKGNTPDFTDYDVVILDLEKTDWSDEVKSDFQTYVKSGGGVVALSSTISAFGDWPAASKIFGMSAGPVLKKSNKAYEYQIVNSKIEHPVINGLQQRWMHSEDYMLYTSGDVDENVEVLAQARADSINGGNNEMIPVMSSVSYGEGRVFSVTLGYATNKDHIKAIQCVGYITSLQRGAEWAATGVVSQEVPIDFPNSASTHLWNTYKPLEIDEILEKAATYEVGKSRKYLADFSARLRHSDGKAETYASFETKIIEFLDSDATIDSKKYMCKELSWMGSEKSIPVLEKLVNDKELSESAAYALQRLRM